MEHYKPCCPLISHSADYRIIIQEMDALSHLAIPLHYQVGQVIFYEGHSPVGFFVIICGQVVFTRQSTDGDHLIPVRSSDHYLGLNHLLAGTPFCMTCRAALPNVEVFFFPKPVVFDYLAKRCRANRSAAE